MSRVTCFFQRNNKSERDLVLKSRFKDSKTKKDRIICKYADLNDEIGNLLKKYDKQTIDIVELVQKLIKI